MPSDNPDKLKEAGFTLIEMLVVIVILGLAAGIIMTHGAPRNAGVAERAAASEIVQSLRLARSQAIAHDMPITVYLDEYSHHILVNNVDQPLLPASLPITLYPQDTTARGSARFVFAPDGSASGGTILLGPAGSRIRIAIDWLTGHVDVSHAR